MYIENSPRSYNFSSSNHLPSDNCNTQINSSEKANLNAITTSPTHNNFAAERILPAPPPSKLCGEH